MAQAKKLIVAPKEDVVSNQRLVKITVNPGDFDTKYKLLQGHGGGWQRTVNRRNARRLLADWNSVETESVLTLLDREDGGYWILDGQHRIFAASNILKKPSAFVAVIRDSSWKGSTAEQVAKLNSGNPFKVGDHLENKQEYSIFPEIFEAAGFPVSDKLYGSGNQHATWSVILRGHISAKKAWKARSWRAQNSSTKEIFALWEADNAAVVNEVAQVAQWWETGASIARTERKLNNMYTAMGYVFAHLLWWSNQDHPSLEKAPVNLARWPELHALSAYSNWKHSRLFIGEALRGINYRKQKKLVVSVGF